MEALSADDPQQVSVYRLRARLGAGGMGRVYLASSPGGRAVAVKVVHPELARDAEFMQRFRREVEAAESVSGAYTAPVIGAGPGDDPPWLATAYVPGPSLADLVRRAGPLPEAAVWRLAGGLVEALQAIHRRGLVHRDLKPGNILIAADGPRVIDFGISRALQGTAITTARTTMGTPAYMSPEQAAGSGVGPASDVFSLGSVLAFAASGKAPFDGGDTLSVIYRIVHAEPGLGPLPAALARLAGWCLVKDPAARPGLDALLTAVTAEADRFGDSAPGQFWPEPVASALAADAQAAPSFPAGAGPTPPGGYGPAAYQSGPPTGPTPPGGYPPADQGPYAGGPTGPTGPGAYPGSGGYRGGTVPPGGPGGPPRRSSRRWLVAIAGAGVAAAAIGATLAVVLPASGGGQPNGVATSKPGTADAATSSPFGPSPTAAAAPATSPPAASTPAAPATSASPSDSLIAVTVCTFPADGCNLPGSAQYMQSRPKMITDSGDGSGYINKLTWSSWGGSQADGAGSQWVDDCTPDCATGHYTSSPVTLTLTGRKPYGTGVAGYSTIVIRDASGNVAETYTQQTIPS